MFLCVSIPGVKNKAIKRKLIYEPNVTPQINETIFSMIAQILYLELKLI